MDHFAGLDVSVKETSVCILDDAGKIVKEVKVASEPQALLKVLGNPAYRFKRIGLEAGSLSQWLFNALAEAGLPVICVETRHMQAMLKAQINKTDRNDARGIAQMMRVGVYRVVHVKIGGQDGQSEAEQPDHPASLGDSITASYSDEVFGTHRREFIRLFGATAVWPNASATPPRVKITTCDRARADA